MFVERKIQWAFERLLRGVTYHKFLAPFSRPPEDIVIKCSKKPLHRGFVLETLKGILSINLALRELW